MKCPFCKNDNTVLMVEVETDDCTRICFECTNCSLRSPGVEQLYNASDEETMDNDILFFNIWSEMCEALEKVWPE